MTIPRMSTLRRWLTLSLLLGGSMSAGLWAANETTGQPDESASARVPQLDRSILVTPVNGEQRDPSPALSSLPANETETGSGGASTLASNPPSPVADSAASRATSPMEAPALVARRSSFGSTRSQSDSSTQSLPGAEAQPAAAPAVATRQPASAAPRRASSFAPPPAHLLRVASADGSRLSNAPPASATTEQQSEEELAKLRLMAKEFQAAAAQASERFSAALPSLRASLGSLSLGSRDSTNESLSSNNASGSQVLTLEGLRSIPAVAQVIADRIAAHRYVQSPAAALADLDQQMEDQFVGTELLETWRGLRTEGEIPQPVATRRATPVSRRSMIWLAHLLDRAGDQLKQVSTSLESYADSSCDLGDQCDSESGAETLSAP